MGKQNNMGTYELTTTGSVNGDGTYVIQADDGVSVMALKLSGGGSATITGAARIKAFGDSEALALVPDEPTILSNPDLMDNLTITVISGTVKVITNQ